MPWTTLGCHLHSRLWHKSSSLVFCNLVAPIVLYPLSVLHLTQCSNLYIWKINLSFWVISECKLLYYDSHTSMKYHPLGIWFVRNFYLGLFPGLQNGPVLKWLLWPRKFKTVVFFFGLHQYNDKINIFVGNRSVNSLVIFPQHNLTPYKVVHQSIFVL